MCLYAKTLSSYHGLNYQDPDPSELKRAAMATVILVALFAMFAFAPPRDPTKVVAGIPCSVLSENEVGAVLGAPMRLMPTDGTICHYASTANGPSRALFVVARREPSVPNSIGNDVTPVHGLGDAAARAGNTLYVRYGQHSYAFTVVPMTADGAPRIAEELRLAKLLHRQLIARH